MRRPGERCQAGSRGQDPAGGSPHCSTGARACWLVDKEFSKDPETHPDQLLLSLLAEPLASEEKGLVWLVKPQI